eukprot:TRINITY_DN4757_c0_g1_i1.p1 TRINITY_DN4757_c0_g1~~TRINITY_DN4757_c0_g1_i1.p1  ORF type:complete len:140 (+),score=28.94 TRINITY_DN4757_c0_g1_i1:72-491(+)
MSQAPEPSVPSQSQPKNFDLLFQNVGFTGNLGTAHQDSVTPLFDPASPLPENEASSPVASVPLPPLPPAVSPASDLPAPNASAQTKKVKEAIQSKMAPRESNGQAKWKVFLAVSAVALASGLGWWAWKNMSKQHKVQTA